MELWSIQTLLGFPSTHITSWKVPFKNWSHLNTEISNTILFAYKM